MKKTLLLFIALCITSSFFVGAAQWTVTTVAEFNTAMTSYAVDDEIIISAGTYAINGTKSITKSVTIKASPDAVTKPVLAQLMFTFNATGCSLTLDGLDIYWDAEGVATPTTSRYFITSTAGIYTIPTLAINNCAIHGFGRTLLRSDGGSVTSITNLNVSNSMIYDMGRENPSYSVFAVKTAKISNATFTNSTIYSCANGFWYSEMTSVPIVFSMDKCCLIKNTSTTKGIPTVTTSKRLFNANANPNSSYTFKDCIISDSYDATTNNMTMQLNCNNTTITGHINNSILANNFAATKITGTLTTNTEVATTALSYDFATLKINTTPTTITGIGDPRWTLNPVVAVPATLSTSVLPLGAGTVTVSPNLPTYNVGDQITLTQTRNFGYEFKEWQDGEGNLLSTNASYQFNILANTTVKAVYNTLTTYNYTVTKVGSQWGNVLLNPAPTNGKYEAGTTVTMSVVPNAVTNFSYWEDNSTTTSRVIAVDADKSFTATFDEIPFIVGWNFLEQSVRTARQGDFYSELSNTGVISLYEPAGTPVNWLASLASFSPSYSCVRIWTAGANFASTRRYFEASFATTGYSNIQVKSLVGGNYQCYSIQKMQYSLDGTTFTDLNTADITSVYNAGWVDLNATLPLAAEGQTKVYIRWVADVTSPVLGLATDNDGMALTNIYVFADKVVVNDVTAPTLISSVPVEASTNASANGSIVLTFDEKMKVGSGNCNLGATTLTPSFGSKTVTFPYTKLAYNTDFTFTVPAGALTDMSGNAYTGITLNFKTMNRPQPIAKIFDAIVAADGTGNYSTLQAAISATPDNSGLAYLIFVKNGNYTGHVEIPASKPNIHLIGQSRDSVIVSDNRLCGDDGNGTPVYHVSLGATVVVNAANTYFENITFQNSVGYLNQTGPQALAMYSNNDKIAFKNCTLRSYQDTYLTSTRNAADRHYLLNCRVEGAVDFIYGGGDVFFDACTVFCTRLAGGYIVAPSHSVATQWGYVFSNCTLDGSNGTVTYLGRPWQGAPKTSFFNTTAKIGIYPGGWYYKMGAIPAIFADYNTMDATGSQLDLSQRISNYEYDVKDANGVVTSTVTGVAKKSFTDTEAAQYTLDNVVQGTDNWDPRILTEATDVPANVINTAGTLTWNATNYAICYLVLRNNKVVGMTTSLTYTDGEYAANAQYAVVAVAASGALSQKTMASNSSNSTAVKNATATKVIAYGENNVLYLSNLPAQAKVELYSFSGKLLLSQQVKSSTATFQMLENNAIVRVISTNETVVLKVTK